MKDAEEYEEEMDEEEELEEEMLEEVCIEPQLVLCISRSSVFCQLRRLHISSSSSSSSSSSFIACRHNERTYNCRRKVKLK